MNNDLISREALRKELTSETRDEFEFVCLSRVLEKIDKAQAAEPEYVYFAKVTFDEDKLKELTDDIVERIKNGEIVGKYDRPQGEWILKETDCDDGGNNRYECTNCHYSDVHAGSAEVPYCWHCGAKNERRCGMSEEELNNYLDALSKEHSDFIQKWTDTLNIPELDEYVSHLTEEEKDALFILLIIKFTKLFDKEKSKDEKGGAE